MKKILLIAIATYFFASIANATVTVEDKVMQKGLFRGTDCENGKNRTTPPECLCKADIHYPEIKGLANKAAQEKINQFFKALLEKNNYSKCFGKLTNVAEKDGQSWVNQNHEVTFQSDTILAIINNFSTYGSGAAHGNKFIEGTVIDKKTGKVLTAIDIFGKNIPQVNQIIYDKLNEIDGIDHDSIKKLKGNFLKKHKCNDCTLLLAPDGVTVAFGVNSVAMSAAGIPKVLITKEYITNTAIKQSFGSR